MSRLAGALRLDDVRRRVLVISDYGWATGGTEEFVRALLEALRRPFATELVTWGSSVTPIPTGVDVTRIDHGDVLRVWSAVARADVVLVVTSFNVRLLAKLTGDVLRHTRTPAITVVQTSAHSTPSAAAAPEQERWLKQLIALSRVVVGASVAVRDGVVELLGEERGHAPLVVIENGARLADRGSHRRDRDRVTFIGRPTDSKGYPSFLRVVDALAGSGLRFAANTVSIQPEREHAGVAYTRCLSDAQLVALFADTDLLLAPYWRADGLPLALLEALNCGVPIMGFDSPAVGPLLRAHAQHVVPCDSKRLIKDVRTWRAGRLDVPPPVAGSVASLAEQAGRYVRLVEGSLRERHAHRWHEHAGDRT